MQALFDTEAKKYNVYPLSNDTFARHGAAAGKSEFSYSGVTPVANTPNIIGRSYTVTADIEVPADMLILKQYQWIIPDVLTPGKRTVVL